MIYIGDDGVHEVKYTEEQLEEARAKMRRGEPVPLPLAIAVCEVEEHNKVWKLEELLEKQGRELYRAKAIAAVSLGLLTSILTIALFNLNKIVEYLK